MKALKSIGYAIFMAICWMGLILSVVVCCDGCKIDNKTKQLKYENSKRR